MVRRVVLWGPASSGWEAAQGRSSHVLALFEPLPALWGQLDLFTDGAPSPAAHHHHPEPEQADDEACHKQYQPHRVDIEARRAAGGDRKFEDCAHYSHYDTKADQPATCCCAHPTHLSRPRATPKWPAVRTGRLVCSVQGQCSGVAERGRHASGHRSRRGAVPMSLPLTSTSPMVGLPRLLRRHGPEYLPWCSSGHTWCLCRPRWPFRARPGVPLSGAGPRAPARRQGTGGQRCTGGWATQMPRWGCTGRSPVGCGHREGARRTAPVDFDAERLSRLYRRPRQWPCRPRCR